MDIEWVKSKLEQLKEKVVSKRDYHFREFILEDIFDAGEVDYIVGDNEWYLYWMSRANDIKGLLDYMISKYNSKLKGHDKLLNDCMEIKLIIDKNLKENPYYIEEEVLADMGVEVEGEPLHNYLNIPNEEKKEVLVTSLLNALSNKGYIKNNQPDFIKHFNPYSGNLSKIQWYGTEVQITALFLYLVKKGVIDRSYEYRIPSTIPNHFINKKGKDFNDRQLRVSLSRVRSGDVDHLIGIIVKLVEELTEIN